MNDLSDIATTPVARAEPRTPAELKEVILAKLSYSVGKIPEVASPRDWFLAVAFATRDMIVDRWIESTSAVYADKRKRVYYLSLEFLIGRLLFDAMTNLGVADADGRSAEGAWRQPRRASPPRAGRRAWQRRPRSPRRLFHGQHGDPRRSPPMATASATTTGCSARSSAAAGSRRRPRTGSQTAIPGSSSGRSAITRSASAAGSKWSRARTTAPVMSGIPARRSKR